MALQDKARGQRIAQLRKRTPGLTQQAVAQKLGIGYRTIQSWESGAVVPEWPNVERLARYYKVRPESIMGDMPAPAPNQLDRIEAKLDELLRREPLRDADRQAVADLDDIPDAPPSVSNEPVDVPSDRRTP